MTSSAYRMTGLAALFAVTGCSTPTEIFALRCDVTVDDISPQPATVGASVTLTGTPFTSTYDSAVYVGGERATVTDVARTNCTNCDSCRIQNGCTECQDCDACDAICASECVETVTFDVPELPAGDYGVQLFNAHGQSPVLDLTIQSTGFEGTDTGSSDTGDTGTSGAVPSP